MTCGLLGNLGVLGRGPLGCAGAAFGVPSSLCFPATFITCAASPPQLLPHLRSGVISLCCGARLTVQGCHQTAVSRTGILQPVVCDSGRHGRLAPCNRSFAPQLLCLPIPVPYGNFGVCPSISAPQRLDGFYRLTRHLPPSPCPSGFAEVSALLRGFESFPVQGPLFWAFFGAASVHPGHCSSLLHYASVWFQDPPLPGRLARTRILITGDLAGEGLPLMAFAIGRDVIPVPVPKYQNWYPYPSTHCGTRTRVSTWLGTRTRTRTHFIVPVPIFQPSLVPVPTGWYLYPYLRVGTRTCTRVPVLVPVPIPIKSVNPSSFVSIILVPLLLHYPTHCTHVCGFVSLYLQCSDSTDTPARFVDYFHSAKKRCFT